MDLMDDAIAGIGIPVRRLVSGAGHDAMAMAALLPDREQFVRCAGGISHNPAEAVAAEDAEVAFRVMRRFVDALGARARG